MLIRVKQLILFSNQRISIGNDLNFNLGHNPKEGRVSAPEIFPAPPARKTSTPFRRIVIPDTWPPVEGKPRR